MFPTIRNGDFVTIVTIEIDDLCIGDIIFFKKKNTHYLHRYIKRNNNGELITKGDNRINYDIPINSDEILGKCILIKRNNRNINLDTTLNRKIGKLFTLFPPITYPILLSLISGYNFFLRGISLIT